MKKRCLFLISIVLIFSCKNKESGKDFHKNGNIKISKELNRDGIPDGVSKEYYSSGELKEKREYRNGRLVDTVYIYHKNGNLKEKGQIVNSLRNGWWFFYDERGILQKKDEYINVDNRGPRYR